MNGCFRRPSSLIGPSRRAVLGAGFAMPFLGALSAAEAQAGFRIRTIAVDVSPLDRFGGGGARNLLEPALAAEMRKVFADVIDGRNSRAPVLTARVTNLYLAPYDGVQTFDSFGGNDNIEGDGIVSTGQQVASTTHILTELPPSYSGSRVTVNLDLVRYQSISYQFAYWLRREMGV